MSSDYFLLHRAMQIQRLGSGTAGSSLQIPDRRSRGRTNPALLGVCTAVEAIEKLPLGEDVPQRKSLLDWLRIPRFLAAQAEVSDADEASTEPLVLTAAERELLEKFEEDLVRLALDDDPSAAAVATQIMQAIWADQAFFNGLKPLAIHSDEFPYEFLFPTWFNLYTALSRPTDDGSPRLSEAQRQTVFQFLDEAQQAGLQAKAELLGLMTFLANRVPGPRRIALLQQLIDLSCVTSEFRCEYLETLSQMRERVESAAAFQPLLNDYLIVESCLQGQPIASRFTLDRDAFVYREIPSGVAGRIRTLEGDAAKWQAYRRMLHQLAIIHTQANGLETTWSAVLNRSPQHVDDLLGITAPGDPTMTVLPRDVQRIVAKIVDKQGLRIDASNLQTIRHLAHDLASRMDDLDPHTAKFVDVEFLGKPANRQALLDSVNSPDKRKRLAAQLAAHARQATDPDRMFDLLVMAAVMDPSIERASLVRIKLSVRVLRMAQENGSIGKKELDDLVADLVQNLPESIQYLDSPLAVAGSKSDRLAKLYLALYEEREVFSHSGTVANFGVTRASYGNLRRIAEEFDS